MEQIQARSGERVDQQIVIIEHAGTQEKSLACRFVLVFSEKKPKTAASLTDVSGYDLHASRSYR